MSEPTRLTAEALAEQGCGLPKGSFVRKLPVILGLLGLIGLGVSFALKGGAPKGQFYFSYLVAFTFWLSISLGAMFFVFVHFATRGGWGVVVRRMAETLMAMLPLFLLLFIPVVLGMHSLYHHWTDTAAVAKDPILSHKSAWLNESFFLVRAGIYLVIWTALALFYYRQSVKQDQSGEARITRRLELASAPGIMLFAITATFASFDWLMSIDPHWYSTIYGVYFFAGSMVSCFALLIILTVVLEKQGTGGVISVEHLHDLGKLLFAFTCFWAYIAFSQFMLYWYGNIPEETMFFAKRWFVVPSAPASKSWAESGWKTVSILLAAGHFVVPFLLLMPRTIKRHRGAIVVGALWMLGMHALDLYWLVMPNLHVGVVRVHALDVTTFVGVGGVFMAVFFWLLGRQALVPIRDPRLGESLQFENF